MATSRHGADMLAGDSLASGESIRRRGRPRLRGDPAGGELSHLALGILRAYA